MELTLEWWAYMLIAAFVFGVLLLLNYLMKRYNDSRLERKMIKLFEITPTNTRVASPLLLGANDNTAPENNYKLRDKGISLIYSKDENKKINKKRSIGKHRDSNSREVVFSSECLGDIYHVIKFNSKESVKKQNSESIVRNNDKCIKICSDINTSFEDSIKNKLFGKIRNSHVSTSKEDNFKTRLSEDISMNENTTSVRRKLSEIKIIELEEHIVNNVLLEGIHSKATDDRKSSNVIIHSNDRIYADDNALKVKFQDTNGKVLKDSHVSHYVCNEENTKIIKDIIDKIVTQVEENIFRSMQTKDSSLKADDGYSKTILTKINSVENSAISNDISAKLPTVDNIERTYRDIENNLSFATSKGSIKKKSSEKEYKVEHKSDVISEIVDAPVIEIDYSETSSTNTKLNSLG